MSRVLLVDDESEILDILSFALELSGHEVSVAEGYSEALRILAVEKVDCLVTDYRLPGDSTGMDLIRHARETLSGSPRAVLITGYSGVVDHQGLVEAIFHKPFDIDSLVAWVGANTGGASAELG